MKPHLCAMGIACAGIAIAACERKKDPPEVVPPAPTATIAPAAAAAKPLPPGRSPVPSPAEYAAAREVTVKGSSALACETKMIREWLRVTCRGKNDTGGTPTTVVISRGGRGETVMFAGGGVTSIITPVLAGTDFEARFSWTDKSHALVIKWPQGTPLPVVIGQFEGAASPLDGTAPSAVLCECHKRIRKAKDCSEAPFANLDCERTYAGNCEKMLACASGDPAMSPSCQTGKRNAGVTGWCASLCGAGKPPCTAGTECSHDWGDPPVCL